MADGSHTSETLRREVFRLHLAADELEQRFHETGGEVTDETAAMERFVAESGEQTIAALCGFLAAVDDAVDAGVKELARLKARSDALDKRKAWGKLAIQQIMAKLGTRKLEVGTYAVSLVAGHDIALCDVDFHDVAELPLEFVREVPARREPDKRVILEALKAGRNIRGWILSKTAVGVRIK